MEEFLGKAFLFFILTMAFIGLALRKTGASKPLAKKGAMKIVQHLMKR